MFFKFSCYVGFSLFLKTICKRDNLKMSIDVWDHKHFSFFLLNKLAVQHLSFDFMKKMELLKCPGKTTIPYEQSSLHGNIIFCGLLNFDSNVDKLALMYSVLL